MKKLTVLSIMAASVILVGCGDSATGAEAKAAAEHKTETSAKKCESGKCESGKCGGDKKSAATEAKEAVSNAAEKVTAAASEKATEVKETVVEKAAAATAAVAATATAAVASTKEAAASVVETTKDAATAAVDSTKEAASAVADKATEAVAAATGPDGKALFTKCAACHGADGKTSAMGKSAIIAGQAAADIETKINGYKAGTLNTAGMGALMKGQVAAMSDADIKAIAAYISGL